MTAARRRRPRHGGPRLERLVAGQHDVRRLELGLAVQQHARSLAARDLVPPVAVARRGPVHARVAHDDARQPHARAPGPAGWRPVLSRLSPSCDRHKG
jgi:hypothetical protein